MATKIFMLGATGFIGGDALSQIVPAHPEYDITCLVRSSEKGAQVASQFPKIRLVYGDMADEQLLEGEARNADIVLNCAAADNNKAVRVLVRGLAFHTKERPGYLIHTSGTATVCFADIENNTYGEASTKVYDDWDGLYEATVSLPETELLKEQRTADKVVFAAGPDHPSRIKTAIVSPPCIYGKGRGPGNQRSGQMPDLTKCILQEGKGFTVGKGLNLWANVHVHDLSDCYLKLVEAAASGGGTATWNEEGYYFMQSGELVWAHMSKLITMNAHEKGLISPEEIVSISTDKANSLRFAGAVAWGANSRARAIRARNVLGWSPTGNAIEDTIDELVDMEARRLGMTQGHAAKVAG